MTITINGENIDFTLEEENNAGEIIRSLSSWLEEAGMLISGLNINGESHPLSDSGWTAFPVNTIENISIEALSLREGRIIQLETARDFFLLLEAAINSGDDETFTELRTGFNDLEHILPHLLEEGPNPSILPLIKDAFTREPGHPEGVKASQALHIAAVLESRRKEASDPESEAGSAAEALAGMAESLEEVAVQLQTGQDKTAMKTIILLTELLQTFMRALSWVDNREKVEEIINDINRILVELEEALKAGDTVLIGDLLEYEIKPRLLLLPEEFNCSTESRI